MSTSGDEKNDPFELGMFVFDPQTLCTQETTWARDSQINHGSYSDQEASSFKYISGTVH